MNTSFLPILTTIVFAEDSNSTIINENATEKEKVVKTLIYQKILNLKRILKKIKT